MNALKRWRPIAALSAWLDQYEAETRTGISLLEAADHDDFLTELRSLIETEEGRGEIRQMAIQLAQAGIRPHEVPEMAAHFLRSQPTWVDGRHQSVRYHVLTGTLVCRHPDCPNRKAPAQILSDSEVGHIVELDEERFHVKHPLHERIDDALLSCTVQQQISEFPAGMIDAGRYRVTAGPADSLDFELIS